MYNLQFKLENINKVFDHLGEIKNYLKLPKEVTVFDYAKEHDLKIYYKYSSSANTSWQLFYHYKSNIGVWWIKSHFLMNS